VDVPDGQRGARFVCAAAIALPDGVTKVVEGRLDGALVEKDAISHRGRAFRAVVPFVAELLGRRSGARLSWIRRPSRVAGLRGTQTKILCDVSDDTPRGVSA